MINKTPMNRVWQAVFFGIPLVLFVVLLLSPEIDPEWNAPVFHFYIVSYISLVSLVVASFVLLGVGTSGWRAVFVAMAFVGIAAMFRVHGLSTPGVLVTGFNQAIGWSARLSLVIGAVFFSLSTLNMPPALRSGCRNIAAKSGWRWASSTSCISWLCINFPNLLRVWQQ